MSSNSSMERIAILEEKTVELGKNDIETNKVLKTISTQVNSLCVSQAKMGATLDNLNDKVDDIREFHKEITSKIEDEIEKNREVCGARHQEMTKITSSLITKQKVIYAIASLVSAGVISVLVKVIVA